MTIVATISLPRVWENKDIFGEVFESEYYLKYVSPEVKTAPLKVMQNLKNQIEAILDAQASLGPRVLVPC